MPNFCGFCGVAGGRGGFRRHRYKCRGCEKDERAQRHADARAHAPPPETKHDQKPISVIETSPPSPSRPAPKLTPERTIVFSSDWHAPFHSLKCLRVFLAVCRDLKPSSLCLGGDYVDLGEISRHSAGSVAQLEGRRVCETWEAGRSVLRQMVEAAGCEDNDYIEGNHEKRVRNWLNSGDNAVWMGSDAMSIDRALDLERFGFRYHDGWPDAYVKAGHLIMTHGRFTNKYHAQKHLDTWRHSVIYGHTHRPQMCCVSSYNTQQVAYGVGYMGDPTSEAFDYAGVPNDWLHSFAVISVRPSGAFLIEPVSIWEGVGMFGGKLYDGNVP